MTREEAIRWLEDIHRRFNPTGENLENEGGDVHLQALDMAIEALKEQPTIPMFTESEEAYKAWTGEEMGGIPKADWVSITEAEPNTSDHVLVTYKWGDDDYEVSELDYWITKYEAEKGNVQCKMLIDHVIAWCYMLAPYKGGDDK